jgi:hypothetical protein
MNLKKCVIDESKSEERFQVEKTVNLLLLNFASTINVVLQSCSGGLKLE